MTSQVKLTEAQVAAIKALENEAGRLTPRLVLEAAKSKTSPLHDLFNWDTKKAAERWWLHRARRILASVHYQFQTQDFAVRAVAYVRDPETKGAQGYRSTVSLRDDKAAARESLVYTLEVAAGHLRRALDLAAPLGLSGEVDALLESVVGVQRIIRSKAA